MTQVQTGWRDKRQKHPWQTMLTAEESAALAAIDADVAKITQRRRELSSARTLIQNRATQRYRYETDQR